MSLCTQSPRHEFIALLRAAVRAFPRHPALSDLHTLVNDADLEIDFFLNVTHIQVSARSAVRLSNKSVELHWFSWPGDSSLFAELGF